MVLECIVAHENAYVKCKYMHRDVSAGNILIRVCVRKTDKGHSVYWEGILSDWELAKHVDSEIALQPQRTGTWHFMSVYQLVNPGKPSTIADELEAFLHVVIYGAFRRMNSTLLTITGFNTQYFQGCAIDDTTTRVTCPLAKRASVMTGSTLTSGSTKVKFFSPRGNDQEQHPLNDLIARLLHLFHSRYVVDEWENRPSSSAAPATPVRRKRLETIHEVSEPMPDMGDIQDEADDTDAGEEPTLTDGIEEPTTLMYQEAKSLARHAKVRKIFWNALYASEKAWPEKDVVEDRMVSDVVSLLPSSHAPDARRPAKRPRREPARQAVAGPSDPGRRVTRSRTAANVAATTSARPADSQPAARTADSEPQRTARSAVRNRAPPAAPSQDTGRRVTRSQSRALLAQAAGQAAQGQTVVRGRAAGTHTGRRPTRAATGASTRSGGTGKAPAAKSAPAGRGRGRSTRRG
ncbi:hypothetical protein C8Q76DRAFT_706749 [Earliella scabrosa]|nr:hypothetical protein C8Q76DRAFT_706749 [Earliella scabrosa]